jgi:hypothetical protein
VGRINQGELTIVQLKEIPSSDLLVELSAFGDAPSASTGAVSSGAGAVSSAASLSSSTASLPSIATVPLDSNQVSCLLRPCKFSLRSFKLIIFMILGP